MIDIAKLQPLVLGALTAPRETWDRYRDPVPDPKNVFLGFTLPVVVTLTVVAALLSFVFGTQDVFFAGSGRSVLALLREMVLGSLLGLAGIALMAYLVLALARVFGGSGEYGGALAMVSLVAVPALLAGVPGALPWIGWLIQLAAGIYSLVLLYQAIPVFLHIDGGKRPLHFIASVLTMVVINVILGALFGASAPVEDRPARQVASGAPLGLGEMAALQEAAAEDRYEPPRNGEVSREQVRQLLRVADDTVARRARYLAEAEKADSELSQSNVDGFAAMARALGSAASGISAGVRALSAEMEAVKALGGNWAEHQWVRERLQRARFGIADEPGQDANRALYAREKAQIDAALDQLQNN
ncbi:MAG: Yip1 family protein [Oceanococcaceae bacterium]